MKVTTDACILGAWAAVPQGAKRILDIGTGTGLLALMIAQRFQQVRIDGVEINAEAAIQAKENVSASHWSDRINIIQTDVAVFAQDWTYDYLIVNPPFFRKSLLGPDQARNAARHTQLLDDKMLLNVADKLLSPTGSIAILLPPVEFSLLEKLFLESGWYCSDLLKVYRWVDSPPVRVVALFSRIPVAATQKETLVIHKDANSYTPQFEDLMRPYYLNL